MAILIYPSKKQEPTLDAYKGSSLTVPHALSQGRDTLSERICETNWLNPIPSVVLPGLIGRLLLTDPSVPFSPCTLHFQRIPGAQRGRKANSWCFWVVQVGHLGAEKLGISIKRCQGR